MEDNFSEFNSSLIKVPLVVASVGESNTVRKMSLITIALLSIVAAAFIKFIVLIWERLEKHKVFDKGNIPSIDRKIPFAGHLLDTREFTSQNLGYYHEKLGKSFGFFYGPDPWLITVDRELLHKVIVVDGYKHIDVAQLRWPFVKEFNKSTFQLRGQEWRRIRRILTPPFAHRQMKTDNVFRDIEGVCTKVLTCIRGHPLQSDGRIIDVLNVFQKFALEIIFRVAYGRENAINMEPGSKDEFIESIDALLRSVQGIGVLLSIMFDSLRRPIGYLIKFTQLGHLAELIHSTISDCLVDRRRMLKRGEDDVGSSKSEPSRKMIDTLIELVDNNKLDDATLKANMFMILMAGFETTANASTTTFWLLARHPEIQEKLRQAIKIEGEEAIYLDWCIKESMRLYPSVPGTGRIVSEDIKTSHGQTIFKGTTIMVNIYSLNHCEEYWGPDVEKFRPERFSEPPENLTQYLPFGGGPRGCLGKSLAMSEMRAIVTRIILNFKVETCDSTPEEIVWSSPNLFHTLIEGQINLRFVELNCS